MYRKLQWAAAAATTVSLSARAPTHARTLCRRYHHRERQAMKARSQVLIVESYLLRAAHCSILAVNGWAGGVRGRQVKVMQIARLLIVASARMSRVRLSRWRHERSSIIYDHLRRQALFEHRTASTVAYCSVCRCSWLSLVYLSVCLSVCGSAYMSVYAGALSQPLLSNFRLLPACQLTLYSHSLKRTLLRRISTSNVWCIAF